MDGARQNKSTTAKSHGPVEDPTAGFSLSRDSMSKDGEISVFGADKYFNMKLEYQTMLKVQDLHKNQVPVNLSGVGSNIRAKTPSLCSEASSVNSQSALLLNFHKSESQIKEKRGFGRNIFTRFGCRPPCFNKKAVCVIELPRHLKDQAYKEEASNGTKPIQTESKRINHLALVPLPNPLTDISTFKKQLKIEDLEDSRISIEVFGSGSMIKGDIAANLERKLSLLTWDAIPKVQTIPTCTTCDDMASDASSDLFEIEHISVSLNPLSTTDDMSSCLSPQSHYEPSEASIQWSVVTASAADYTSVVPSDFYNDDTSVSVAADIVARKNRSLKTRNGGGKETQKIPRGLLGCKSYKAVDVAEIASHKTGEKVVKHHQGVDFALVR